MFLLKYIFGLREKSILMDEEKPFLSHLEDFRKMLIRIIITLIVGMGLCFNFAPQLLDFLRLPVESVWKNYEDAHLPSQINVESWIEAKQVAAALAGLPLKAQEVLLKKESPEAQCLIESSLLLKAMQTLPKDSQQEFLKEAASSPEVIELVHELDKTKALTQSGEGGSGLKMMSALQPSEAFNLSVKLALYASLVLTLPLILYYILEFILPGLHAKERKTLFYALFIGFGLFLTGVVFAYFMVLPRILEFFFNYSMDLGISNDWRIGFYLSFTMNFVLLFGLSFELPVFVMPFVKLGILNYAMMKRTRRYAITIIAIAAAILTPQDVISMLMMGVPMYLLYEICIFLAWKDEKKQNKEAALELAREQAEWAEGKSLYQENKEES